VRFGGFSLIFCRAGAAGLNYETGASSSNYERLPRRQMPNHSSSFDCEIPVLDIGWDKYRVGPIMSYTDSG